MDQLIPTWCRRTTLASPFGTLHLYWFETPAGPKVWQITLPTPWMRLFAGEGPSDHTSAAENASCPRIDELKEHLLRFLKGADIRFDLELAAMERCHHFQQRVLAAEHAVPRGYVTTYGHIARYLQMPGAARAVGQALASNPFPLLVPCHRAVLASCRLGGYQGGTVMKEELLRREGIEIDEEKKVRFDKVFY